MGSLPDERARRKADFPFPKLSEPLQLGSKRARNRIVMAPLCAMYAAPDGSVTQRMIDYYRARARGGAGIVIVEITFTDDLGSRAFHAQLGAHLDTMIPGLNELAEAIKLEGAIAGLQLGHCGSQRVVSEPPIVAPSPIAWAPGKRVPHELTTVEVDQVISDFVAAAGRVADAGFDLIEIHGAHGYLVNTFLCPALNRRTDKYGGSADGRLRFATELVSRMRARIGPDCLLGIRMNGDDQLDGGLGTEDYIIVAKALRAAGLDILHASAGTYRVMEQRITPMYLPEGPFIKYAEAFKAALDIPVIASGTIHDPKIGEKLVREGKADFVAFARPLFADPDLPNKLLTGMGDDVIPCIRCNTCVSREQKGARGRCAVNPRTGYENVIDVPAAIPLNVAVVGGGPAGIQAALTAARRGHKVTLYDKGDRLGGMIAVAAGVSFKAPMRRLLDYFNRSLEAAGVHVRLGMEITGAGDLPGRQDVLVLATGAKIPVPDRFRRDGFPAISARDALGSNTRRSRRTVVVGANQIGIETACVLGQAGERVTLIERQDRFADDVNLIDNLVLPRMLEASGVTVRLGTKATSLVGSDVLLEGPKGNDRIAADRVVVAFGAVPDRSVLSTISAEMDLPIHTIGEAAGLFGLYWATHSGDHVGRLI